MISLMAEERLTEDQAMDLLIDLALYSNYIPHGFRSIVSVSDVAEYLRLRGKTIPKCASEMTLYREKPRYFFNLIGATWHTNNVKVSRVNEITGEERQIIDGDGQYHTANYWAKFDQSLSDFERAIAETNHELLLSAFAKGQAAIENFLNVLQVPGIKNCFVEEKLEKVWECDSRRGAWKTARAGEPWASFLEMKMIRNKQEIHNKDEATGLTYPQILAQFNLYRCAIPKTLFELHKLAFQKCPSSIIRANYYPPIRMRRLEQPV